MASVSRRTSTLEMQQRMRKERRFDDTERDLPDFSRHNSTLTSALTTRDKLWAALAYLGKRNPWPRSITSDDTVWLLDNTAYRNEKTGHWEAEYVAAMFSQHSSCPIVDTIDAIADKIELGKHDPGYATLEKRIAPFVQDIKPGTTVDVLYEGESRMKLGPSGHNGISSEVQALPGAHDGKIVPTFARVPKGANGVLEMRTVYAEPEGWGVISGKMATGEEPRRPFRMPD